ncbi:hypothetical protein K8R42_05105, partial [bacterium]|nr:hypothetical protein [bacterium]
LLERSGRSGNGSITGLYTVLVEGDDVNEPIADAVRGILDGHIWLSRQLANRGHYPAVSVTESISRVMPDVVDEDQLAAANRVKELLAIWSEIEDLVNIGAYASGSNPEFDLAIRMKPAIDAFLQQGIGEGFSFEESRVGLFELVGEIKKAETEISQKKSDLSGVAGGRPAPAGKA